MQDFNYLINKIWKIICEFSIPDCGPYQPILLERPGAGIQHCLKRTLKYG